MNQASRRLSGLAFALCGIGCEGEDAARAPDPADADAAFSTPPPASDGSIEVFLQVGTGARRFEAIENGGDVGIVQGPQGGFHVWGGLRADGFDPGAQVRLDFELVQSGSVVARATYYDALERTEAEGPFEYAAVAVVIEKVEPRSVADLPATLRLSLTTEDGHVLEDEIEVIPRCCEL